MTKKIKEVMQKNKEKISTFIEKDKEERLNSSAQQPPASSKYGQMLSMRAKQAKSESSSSLNSSYQEDDDNFNSTKKVHMIPIDIESKLELAQYLKGDIKQDEEDYL